MMNSDTKTEISKKIQVIQESKIKKGNLEIWGGEIDRNELKDFLKAWDFIELLGGTQIEDKDKDTYYSIIETINSMVFERNFDFQNWQDAEFNSLQRARIFGIRGDLEIRKDGSSIFWRFIGDKKPPEKYQQLHVQC